MNWTIQRLDKNVFELRAPMRRAANWEFWVFLSSDEHYDSIKCQRELLKQHWDEALKRKAPIFSLGDFADLMQGTGDKRRNHKDLRPEYIEAMVAELQALDGHRISSYQEGREYLNIVRDDIEGFLKRYASHLALLSSGNHEDTYHKFHNYNITQAVLDMLHRTTRTQAEYGFKTGFVLFRFNDGKRVYSGATMNYHHGEGLGSAAGQQRHIANRPDCDIFVSGHWHDSSGSDPLPVRITKSGKLYHKRRALISLGGYKLEGAEAKEGWSTTKNKCQGSKPGGKWLRFFYNHRFDEVQYEVRETLGLL